MQMLSDKKTAKMVGRFMMLFGLGIGIYFIVMFYQHKAEQQQMMNARLMEAGRMANVNMNANQLDKMEPNQYLSCESPQLNKLDECDADDSPDVGSNWMKYILNQ